MFARLLASESQDLDVVMPKFNYSIVQWRVNRDVYVCLSVRVV